MKLGTQQPGSTLGMGLMIAALGAVCIPSADALAGVMMNSNGGTSCKASNGNGAKLFYFSNQFAENTHTTPQYLTCAIAEMNPLTNRSATSIGWALTNTTEAEVSFACALTSGNSEFGGDINTAVYVVAVAANDSEEVVSNIASTPALPLRSSAFSPYALSCLVPAGGRVGRTTSTFPETF